jgi:hypothetical protein
MAFVQNPIPTYSEAQMLIMLPPAGGLYFFYNSDKENNLYSVDNNGVFVFVSDKDDDNCNCCLAEKWLKGLTDALESGSITGEEYNAAIAQGFVASTTDDGAGNSSVSIKTIYDAVTGVNIEEATKSIVGASTGQLHGHALPASADQRLLWISANPSVASVDQTGLVTTYASYTTVVITAYSVADPTKHDSCTVTVTPP